MSDDEHRRRVLEERARKAGGFVGRDARPNLLGDAMAFKPDFSRVGELDSERYLDRTAGKTPVRPFVGGGSRTPELGFDRYVSNQLMDGVTHIDTQWIGFIQGAGTTTIGSNVITGFSAVGTPVIGDIVNGPGSFSGSPVVVTGVDPVGRTLTVNQTATTNSTGICSISGQTHSYPSPANGYWQFHLNLILDLLVSRGSASTSAGSTTITQKVEILDSSATVLSTGSITWTMSYSTYQIVFVSLSMGTEQFSSFSGVRFTTTGDDGLAPSHTFSNTPALNILAHQIQVIS